MYYYSTYTWHAVESLDTFSAFAWCVFAMSMYGIFRLWKGLRLDAFERSIRTLNQQPHVALRQPSRSPATGSAAPRAALFQISLLPLMLASSGIAILIAQAQRPDDLSRPVTWGLFVTVGAWYGCRAWPHRRGVGPLRNFSLAGVGSAMLISAAVWGFYLAVDFAWKDGGFHRMTSSVPVLLWWTAVGGVVGGLIGAVHANQWYSRLKSFEAHSHDPTTEVGDIVTDSRPPRTRRLAWGTCAMACFASLLFHLSAAPHLHRAVEQRYWWTSHWRPNHFRPMTLTLAPIEAFDNQAPTITFADPRIGAVLLPGFLPAAAGSHNLPTTISVPDQVASTDEMVETVILTRNVAAGDVITNEDLRFSTVASDSLISGRLLTDPNQVQGFIANQPLEEGKPLYQQQLTKLAVNALNVSYLDLLVDQGKQVDQAKRIDDNESGVTDTDDLAGDTALDFGGPIPQPPQQLPQLQPDVIDSYIGAKVVQDGPAPIQRTSEGEIPTTGPPVKVKDPSIKPPNVEGKRITLVVADGRVLKGTVKKSAQADQLTIVTESETVTLNWKDIEQVLVATSGNEWIRLELNGGRMSGWNGGPLTTW